MSQRSKIKKRFEESLSPELKARLTIHVTTYGPNGRGWEVANCGGRGWLLFDQKEILTTEAPGFLYSFGGHRFYNELLDGQTIELGNACGTLLNLAADEARTSRNPYIRGLFALEKRCGRRTLQAMREVESEPIAVLLMSLRAHILGMRVEPFFAQCCGHQVLPGHWLTHHPARQQDTHVPPAG